MSDQTPEARLAAAQGHYPTAHDPYEGDTVCAVDEQEWPCALISTLAADLALAAAVRRLERARSLSKWRIFTISKDDVKWCVALHDGETMECSDDLIVAIDEALRDA